MLVNLILFLLIITNTNENLVEQLQVEDIDDQNERDILSSTFLEEKINDLETFERKDFQDIFKSTEYRLNDNSSSKCNYAEKERLSKCHLVNTFDWDTHNKTLNELRGKFIERLKLLEPKSKKNIFNDKNMLKRRVQFLSRIHNKHEDETNMETKKIQLKYSKFDKKNFVSKTVKTMHIIQG
jgi:hypothetical protein